MIAFYNFSRKFSQVGGHRGPEISLGGAPPLAPLGTAAVVIARQHRNADARDIDIAILLFVRSSVCLSRSKSVAAAGFGRHGMPPPASMTQVQHFVSGIKKRQR